MFGVEPLARIVRHDALKVVKVPAKGTREAYEYWRNFGGSDVELTSYGRKNSKEGYSDILKGFASPKNVFSPLKKGEKARGKGLTEGLKGFGSIGKSLMPVKNAYGLELNKGHFSYSDIHKHQLDRVRRNASKIENETGLNSEDSMKASQALFAYSRSHRSIRNAELAGEKMHIPPLENNKPPAEAISSIYKFLGKAPKAKGEIFRGMILPDQQSLDSMIEGFKKGAKLNCLSSFSSDHEVAAEFSYSKPTTWGGPSVPLSADEKSVVLVVKDNKSGVSIRDYAQQRSEEEVLVGKGVEYRLKKYKTGWYEQYDPDEDEDRTGDGISVKRTYIYLEEIKSEKGKR